MSLLVYYVALPYLWAYYGLVEGVEVKVVARETSTSTWCRNSQLRTIQCVPWAATSVAGTCRSERYVLCLSMTSLNRCRYMSSAECHTWGTDPSLNRCGVFLYLGTGAAFTWTPMSNLRYSDWDSFKNCVVPRILSFLIVFLVAFALYSAWPNLNAVFCNAPPTVRYSEKRRVRSLSVNYICGISTTFSKFHMFRIGSSVLLLFWC